MSFFIKSNWVGCLIATFISLPSFNINQPTKKTKSKFISANYCSRHLPLMWRQNISIDTDDLQPERVGVSCTKISRCVCKTWQKAREFSDEKLFFFRDCSECDSKSANRFTREINRLDCPPPHHRLREAQVWENRQPLGDIESWNLNCRKTDWETNQKLINAKVERLIKTM